MVPIEKYYESILVCEDCRQPFGHAKLGRKPSFYLAGVRCPHCESVDYFWVGYRTQRSDGISVYLQGYDPGAWLTTLRLDRGISLLNDCPCVVGCEEGDIEIRPSHLMDATSVVRLSNAQLG